MVKPIIAGIIDCRHGVFVSTVSVHKDKQRLRKLVFELNQTHGRNSFYLFELDLSLGYNPSFIKKQISKNTDEIMEELDLLNAKYKHYNNMQNLAKLKEEISRFENAFEKCTGLYAKDSKEYEFISTALESEMDEYEQRFVGTESEISRQQDNIKHSLEKAPLQPKDVDGPYFIANKDGYYFVVESFIEVSRLSGCQTFDSLESLLQHVAGTNFSGEAYTSHELEGSEIIVKQVDGDWKYSTHQGYLVSIFDEDDDEENDAADVYQWISEFEL